MGMTQTQMERKLRQLDNDVQSIYEMLTGIAGTQTRQGNRLEELTVAVESGFAAVNAKLDRLLGEEEAE